MHAFNELGRGIRDMFLVYLVIEFADMAMAIADFHTIPPVQAAVTDMPFYYSLRVFNGAIDIEWIC